MSGNAGPVTADELRRFRFFGVLAALLMIGLPLGRHLMGTGAVDPLWERAVVVGATVGVTWASFFYRGRGYRHLVRGVCFLITLWIVHLLILNRFSTQYALGIFLVVAAISSLFRSVRALGSYFVVVVAVMVLAALAAPPGGGVENRPLYLLEFAVVCFLLYATMRGRLRSEEALRRAEEGHRRSERMEAVGRLAGGVAHDFNNLLSVISSRAELLMQAIPEGSPQRDDVCGILEASRRAGEMTRQLLAVGSRESREVVRFDIARRVRGLEEMLRNLLHPGVELALCEAGSPLFIDADPSQVDRILMNLAVNARDAMPGTGRLSVEVGTRDAARLCVLTVSDTGVGIAPDEQEHVFEPFFTTKEEGTGLGLATVYGLVEQNGGSIELDSVPGRGTTFRVLLPMADPAAGSRESSPASPRS